MVARRPKPSPRRGPVHHPVLRGPDRLAAGVPSGSSMADREGCGKDACADTTHVLYTGRSIICAPLSKDCDEEMRKRITAALMAGARFFHLANIRRPRASSFLGGRPTVRGLGGSQNCGVSEATLTLPKRDRVQLLRQQCHLGSRTSNAVAAGSGSGSCPTTSTATATATPIFGTGSGNTRRSASARDQRLGSSLGGTGPARQAPRLHVPSGMGPCSWEASSLPARLAIPAGPTATAKHPSKQPAQCETSSPITHTKVSGQPIQKADFQQFIQEDKTVHDLFVRR